MQGPFSCSSYTRPNLFGRGCQLKELRSNTNAVLYGKAPSCTHAVAIESPLKNNQEPSGAHHVNDETSKHYQSHPQASAHRHPSNTTSVPSPDHARRSLRSFRVRLGFPPESVPLLAFIWQIKLCLKCSSSCWLWTPNLPPITHIHFSRTGCSGLQVKFGLLNIRTQPRLQMQRAHIANTAGMW